MIQRLKTLCYAVAFALLLAAPAGAAHMAKSTVTLTLDSRPVAKKGVVAMQRGAVVFADVIALNKTFNGLMSISGKTYRTIIRGHSVAFTANSRVAVFQGKKTMLPAAPFRYNNSLYVPLAAFGRGIGTAVHFNKAQMTADIISQP